MSAPLSNARAVGLVASREFVTQVQKKSFLISNAIILVAIVVGIVATSVLSGGDDDRPTVGVVGAPALQTTIESLGVTVRMPCGRSTSCSSNFRSTKAMASGGP